MDGQRVKAWEARCIEEQPPACTVGCPLRVDVRGMLAKVKSGDFAGACAIYARSIPLPAMLGRICDHPCETVCRRAEAGGAIRIGAVERACVEAAAETIRRAPQRARKAKRVAVVGAGLSGLTAAFDLAMKGCAVTVFEAELRALTRLTRDYIRRAARAAIEADVAALVKLGIESSANRALRAASGRWAGDVDRRLRCGFAGDRRRFGGPIRRRAERDSRRRDPHSRLLERACVESAYASIRRARANQPQAEARCRRRRRALPV